MRSAKIGKRAAAFLLLLTLLWSSALISAGAYSSEVVETRQKEGVRATAALLADAESGEILFAQNMAGKIYPASTTKLMTALLVMEALSDGSLTMDEIITADDSVWTAMTSESASQNIRPGEELSVRDLLYCLLLPSANDAANVLAAAVSGSVEAFVERMNERAAELGCTGTHFTNTHGMPNDDHYTTARDLLLIFQAALQYDVFRTIISTETYVVEPTNMTEYARTLTNTDLLIRTDDTYYYESCIGGKTGTTGEAGHCLVSAAAQGDLTLICVMMGCEYGTDEEGYTIKYPFSESIALYDWGFAHFSYQTVLTAGETVDTVSVECGGETVSLRAGAAESVRLLLPDDVDANDAVLTTNLLSEDRLSPISRGDVLGTVTVTLDDEFIAEVDLVAPEAPEAVPETEEVKTETEEETHAERGSHRRRAVLVTIFCILCLLVVIWLIFRADRSRRTNRYRGRRSRW